ncbi:hypothetical protein N0V90_000724 [Kalmusia sp. IMI 367209]|nr:hypothetical protein N0V90_000724 [Kalmusia sp. IMI 367209]
MQSTRPLARKKNLLLAFDAFDTLYRPTIPVPLAYAYAAQQHGIDCVWDAACAQKSQEQWKEKDYEPVQRAFRQAYKKEIARNPNYGKATGLGAEKWWANVIRGTFESFLKPQQEVPDALVSELLTRYSSQEGYTLFPDVKPFFQMLGLPRHKRRHESPWGWEKTVVGIITNSDDRVPSILSSFGLKVGPRRVGTPTQRISEATVEDDISFVVLSYDVGYEKPDHRIFDAATQMLKETLAGNASSKSASVDDYERLYVGDTLEKDYFGAERAGWNAILIDRQRGRKDVKEECGIDVLQRARGALVERKKVTFKNGEMREVKVTDSLGGLAAWSPEEK